MSANLRHTRSVRFSRLVGLALAGAIGVAVAGAGCDQATPLCRTGTGAYTVVYTRTLPVPTSPTEADPCGLPPVDLVFVNSYNAPGDEGKPDLQKVSAALTAGDLGAKVDTAEAHARQKAKNTDGIIDPDALNAAAVAWEKAGEVPWGKGDFTTSEPQGDICTIQPFSSQAVINIPAMPAVKGTDNGTHDPNAPDCATFLGTDRDTEASDDHSYNYEWSNWQVYFTAAHAGNQFEVHLKYTVDGTTCEYNGHAALFGNNQSCDSTAAPDVATQCTPKPATTNVDLCDFQAHPEEGIAAGSGVDPAFPTDCNHDTGLCVVTGAFPSLR